MPINFLSDDNDHQRNFEVVSPCNDRITPSGGEGSKVGEPCTSNIAPTDNPNYCGPSRQRILGRRCTWIQTRKIFRRGLENDRKKLGWVSSIWVRSSKLCGDELCHQWGQSCHVNYSTKVLVYPLPCLRSHARPVSHYLPPTRTSSHSSFHIKLE